MFRYDGKLFQFLSKVVDLVILNVIFLICCVPIVTIGASAAAFYTIGLRMVRGEESYIVRPFFKAFKENFKQATGMWLILLLIGAVLGFDAWYMGIVGIQMPQVVRLLFLVPFVLYLMYVPYVFALQAQFENPVKITMKNALIMMVLHFPYTLLMLAVGALPLVVLWYNAVAFLHYLLPFFVIIGFSLIGLLRSWAFARIFQRYMPEKPSQEEGLLTEEEKDAAAAALVKELAAAEHFGEEQ